MTVVAWMEPLASLSFVHIQLRRKCSLSCRPQHDYSSGHARVLNCQVLGDRGKASRNAQYAIVQRCECIEFAVRPIRRACAVSLRSLSSVLPCAVYNSVISWACFGCVFCRYVITDGE